MEAGVQGCSRKRSLRDGSRVPCELFEEVEAGQGTCKHGKEEKGSGEGSLSQGAIKEVRIEACEQNNDKTKSRRGQA